jgi:hypothetical protein
MMNQNLDELPYGPIRSAMETIFGRGAAYLFACIVGCGIGSMMAGGESGSFLSGIVDSPIIFYASFLFSHGLWVWPLVMVLGGFYLRLELPHWVLVFPVVAAIWLSFSVVKHLNHKVENSSFAVLRSMGSSPTEQALTPNFALPLIPSCITVIATSPSST